VRLVLCQGAPYCGVTVLLAQPLNFLSFDEVELRLAGRILNLLGPELFFKILAHPVYKM